MVLLTIHLVDADDNILAEETVEEGLLADRILEAPEDTWSLDQSNEALETRQLTANQHAAGGERVVVTFRWDKGTETGIELEAFLRDYGLLDRVF